MTNVEQVREFHEVFGHPVAEVPGVLPVKRGRDRAEYIRSEVEELEEAIDTQDLVATADALLDAEYFIHGTWVELGLADIKDKLFAEVHKSNMSKSCADIEEAQATIGKYKSQGIEGYIKEVNGRFICYNSITDKVLKSVNFKEPDLKRIIDNYINSRNND